MSEVCGSIVEQCIAKGSTDNITAILVCFTAAKSGNMVQDMIDSWFGGIQEGEEQEEVEEGEKKRKAEEEESGRHASARLVEGLSVKEGDDETEA